MLHSPIFKKWFFPFPIALILLFSYGVPFFHRMGAGLALLSGIVMALTVGNPYPEITKKISSRLLTWSVVGLGCGMNLWVVAKVGFHGIGTTVLSIGACGVLGLALSRWLGVEKQISALVTVGTAICGGSAIAAVAPVLRAKHSQISVSLAIVFLLNAVSLFVFPFLGHLLHLSQEQFGLWCALAIHDTSSVVGASLQYGAQALDVGTTVKLARALWIVPLTLLMSVFWKEDTEASPISATGDIPKPKKPWFILGFLLASALVTFVPVLHAPGLVVRDVAEKALIVTLYCIGSHLSRSAMESVGFKPFLLGFVLWVAMAVGTGFSIFFGWISLH
jgi:uncharacterized integral membrane protein (TIGR00698 family)